MTALAKELQKTPMAPYLGLLEEMTPKEKKIVIMFLTESLTEAKTVAKAPRLSKEERKRGLMSLAGCWADDPEDAARYRHPRRKCCRSRKPLANTPSGSTRTSKRLTDNIDEWVLWVAEDLKR